MGLVLLTPPATPLVTLDEAMLHLRAGGVAESALIEGLVEAATAQAEAFTRRRFVTQSWRLTLDRLPSGALLLPYPPLRSVESLTYIKWVLQSRQGGASPRVSKLRRPI